MNDIALAKHLVILMLENMYPSGAARAVLSWICNFGPWWKCEIFMEVRSNRESGYGRYDATLNSQKFGSRCYDSWNSLK